MTVTTVYVYFGTAEKQHVPLGYCILYGKQQQQAAAGGNLTFSPYLWNGIGNFFSFSHLASTASNIWFLSKPPKLLWYGMEVDETLFHFLRDYPIPTDRRNGKNRKSERQGKEDFRAT